MANRLKVKLHRNEALHITRVSVDADYLVYVFLCDKKLSYEDGKSRIAYIGTTGSGVWRIASSAAGCASTILSERGVKKFEARIVTCARRQRIKSWRKLERAMLLTFKERFGKVPICNSHGKAMKETDEFDYFARERIVDIIDELS